MVLPKPLFNDYRLVAILMPHNRLGSTKGKMLEIGLVYKCEIGWCMSSWDGSKKETP